MTFADTGILHLPGAFTRAQADRMLESIWRFVEANTEARRADPATWLGWDGQPAVSFKRLKRNPVFAPFLTSDSVHAALDGAFGTGEWKEMSPAVQVLMRYPNAAAWELPPRDFWHMDCGFGTPTWPAFAVKLFALVADHEPGGGATLAIAGSHRLVERYTPTLQPSQHGAGKERWGKFARHYSLVDELNAPGEERDIDGVPVKIVEMTGEAGDVYMTHLHVFHAASRNARAQPRMMLGKAVVARSLSDHRVLVDDEER